MTNCKNCGHSRMRHSSIDGPCFDLKGGWKWLFNKQCDCEKFEL